MRILALETTEKFGSVALLDGHHVLAELVLPKDQRSSQTLHPTLYSLFETTQTNPKDIAAVAVVVGPGSFTGLRVGVTSAKVFAYITGAKVIALDTFQTVAAAIGSSRLISVGVDAQRGEVVAAVLRQTENRCFETVRKSELLAVNDWWNHAELYSDVLFAGPALERWSKQAPPHAILAPEADWFPKASSAGILAAERIALGRFDDEWELLPIYSRLSAAEEKSGKSSILQTPEFRS